VRGRGETWKASMGRLLARNCKTLDRKGGEPWANRKKCTTWQRKKKTEIPKKVIFLVEQGGKLVKGAPEGSSCKRGAARGRECATGGKKRRGKKVSGVWGGGTSTSKKNHARGGVFVLKRGKPETV